MWIQKNVAKLYEGIMNFARLISKLIKENNTDITDGYMMQKIFYNLKLDRMLQKNYFYLEMSYSDISLP